MIWEDILQNNIDQITEARAALFNKALGRLTMFCIMKLLMENDIACLEADQNFFDKMSVISPRGEHAIATERALYHCARS